LAHTAYIRHDTRKQLFGWVETKMMFYLEIYAYLTVYPNTAFGNISNYRVKVLKTKIKFKS